MNNKKLEKIVSEETYKVINNSRKKAGVTDIDEGTWAGPIFLTGKEPLEQLKIYYDDMLDGYARWKQGMLYSKSDYKKAYQTIEKMIKDLHKELLVLKSKRKINEETFNAVKKDTGKTSVFKSKETRDAAIKSGTHEKQRVQKDTKTKDTNKDVNIFEPSGDTPKDTKFKLDQPPKDAKQYSEPQVAAQLDKLADMANQAKAKGENAPDFDLCQVSIPGTNLFCAGNKGIPRAQMPQLKGKPAPNSHAANIAKKTGEDTVDGEKYFVQALKKMGVTMTPKKVNADTLKSTQSQLVGTKVAGMAKALEADPKHPAITAPIFVSKDGYVLDGHHRWAAQVGAGILGDKTVMINVIEVDMPIDKLVNYSNEFATKFGIAQKAGNVKESVNESDMTKQYDGFKVRNDKTKDVYKFKYVKGIKNTQVEEEAISKLMKKTGQPRSNFGVSGFVKKGAWITDNSYTFTSIPTESKINKNSNELNSLNEGTWQKIMQGVRKNPQGPFSVVAIKDKKVVGQSNDIRIPDLIPAEYENMKRKYPNARISIENGEGTQVYFESVNEATYDQSMSTNDVDKWIKLYIKTNYPNEYYPAGRTGILGKPNHSLNKSNIMLITKLANNNNNKDLLKLIDMWKTIAKANGLVESVNEAQLTIKSFGDEAKLDVKVYKDKTGHPYVSLYENGEPYADISVILPETTDLPKDEFFVKGWSENKEIVIQLIKNKVLIPTGKKASSGYVEAHSFKLNSKYK